MRAPPPRPKFFQYHAVFGNILLCWNPPGGFVPHLWEILDLPLLSFALIAHLHCTGLGLDRDWEMMGFYTTLCITVHITQEQG